IECHFSLESGAGAAERGGELQLKRDGIKRARRCRSQPWRLADIAIELTGDGRRGGCRLVRLRRYDVGRRAGRSMGNVEPATINMPPVKSIQPSASPKNNTPPIAMPSGTSV